MRICNNRTPFSLSLPLEAARRSDRISSQIDDRFLVEETNRRIEWSFLPLRKSSSPVEKEEMQGEVEESNPEEKRSLKRVDEEKDMKHCVRIDSNLALKDQSEGKDNKQKGSSMDANSQGFYTADLFATWYSNDDNGARTVVLALPAPNSELGKRFLFKNKARQEAVAQKGVSDSKIGVSDTMLGLKEKDSLVEVEVKSGNVKDIFKKEVAAEEVRHAKFDLNALVIEEETETRNINKGLNEIDGFQRALGMNCIIDCDTYVPSWMAHNQQGRRKQVSFDIEKELKETQRRRRKRSGSNQPDSSSSSLQHRELEHERGWSEMVQGRQVFNWWEDERMPKRDRPKMIIDQSLTLNIGNVEKPQAKRGRPERVLDIDLNQPPVKDSM